MATVVTPAQILSALKAIQVKPRQPQYGICNNLDWQLSIELGNNFVHEHSLPNGEPAYTVITELSKKWPKFSGISSYPVPVPDSLKPQYAKQTIPCEAIYDDLSEHKWLGEYGELRRELLQFLIEELENGNCSDNS